MCLDLNNNSSKKIIELIPKCVNIACDVKYLTRVNSNSSSNEQMVKLKVIYYWPLQKKATILDVILRMWTHQWTLLLTTFITERLHQYLCSLCVRFWKGRGRGEGEGEKGWGFGKGTNTCYKNPSPLPTIEKKGNTYTAWSYEYMKTACWIRKTSTFEEDPLSAFND